MDLPARCLVGQSTTSEEFYEHALTIARSLEIPFLVGGAFSFGRYTGIHRDTKDLDLFVKEENCKPFLEGLARHGYEGEIVFPHWLAKVHCDEYFVDVIYSSGNGIARVDDEWFQYARPDVVFHVPVLLCPPEETIWSKAYVMERERYDGADVAHILHACADQLDWSRLLRRFGAHWRVLLSHLVLFGFIYPNERTRIPAWVMDELAARLQGEHQTPANGHRLCQGTFISREQYLNDLQREGYADARLPPHGPMDAEHIALWTAAIEGPPPKK